MTWKHAAAVGVGLLSIVAIVIVTIAHLPKQMTTSNHQLPASSSLIYGTNLGLYDTSDQVVNDFATQQILRDAHIPIIRMPFRDTLDDVYHVRALRAIQYIGAIPLVIIYGPKDPNALADDKHLLALVHAVFGNGMVYVEFGNESNVDHIDVSQYSAAWNTVIPKLKAMSPTYKFIGPALSVFDASYLASFDSMAKPRPDANTWHEYACYPTSSNQECMDSTADWSNHIQTAYKIAKEAAGVAIPSIVTEWNLDASEDRRFNDSTYMRAWTSRALQTLSANKGSDLTAALQYCVTNNIQYSLLDAGNKPTPEGGAFFQTLRAHS